MTACAVASAAMPSARPNGGRVGGPSGQPGDRGEPAHRLGERAEAGARAVGPELAEPGDARDDQPRVGLVQPLGRQAPALEGAGPEVLDEHVGLGDQAQQQLGAGLGVEVQGDRPLVAPEARPPQGDAVLRRPVGARGIGLARVLDLDDVGAVVAEDRGGQGAGEQGGDVDDPDPGQRGRSPAVRRCPGQRRCVGHPRVGHALIVLRRRRTCRAVDPRGSRRVAARTPAWSVPTGPETSRDPSVPCAVHSSDCSAWRNRFPELTPWSGLRHRSDTEFRLNSGTLCRGVEQYALERGS